MSKARTLEQTDLNVLKKRLAAWEREKETNAHGYGGGVADNAIAALKAEIERRTQSR